jgi:hypothetical protein
MDDRISNENLQKYASADRNSSYKTARTEYQHNPENNLFIITDGFSSFYFVRNNIIP